MVPAAASESCSFDPFPGAGTLRTRTVLGGELVVPCTLNPRTGG